MLGKHLMVCCVAALVSIPAIASASPDLAIGFDKKTDRPNAFIAWRNSQRILEVEVEVKNLGTRQGSARLLLEILDESGAVLASNAADEPQIVKLPPAAKGGADGRIVQVKGNLALNLLIDKLDRANVPYLLRSALVPVGVDRDVRNNVAVKTFNLNSRVRPGASHFREFTYRNNSSKRIEVAWDLAHSPIPAGWSVQASFRPGMTSVLAPGQVHNGYILVATPASVSEGEHVDVRVIARDPASRESLYEHEWYAVYDQTGPRISEVKSTVDTTTGLVSLTALVDDGTSMLKEASGVRVEYSTDDGRTFSSRIAAYRSGNFVGPTLFDTQLGPFAPGTKLVGVVVASDIAGNRTA